MAQEALAPVRDIWPSQMLCEDLSWSKQVALLLPEQQKFVWQVPSWLINIPAVLV